MTEGCVLGASCILVGTQSHACIPVKVNLLVSLMWLGRWNDFVLLPLLYAQWSTCYTTFLYTLVSQLVLDDGPGMSAQIPA